MAGIDRTPERLTAAVQIGEVARMLNARARTLAPELLPGGRREGHEWRCGSLAGERGQSLAVHLDGAKAGVWCDFSSGETGDALDLVAQARFRGDKGQALAWARSWLGLDSGDPGRLAEVRRALPDAEEQGRQAEAEATQKRSVALRIWLAARPGIRDTPVERYLAGRAILLAGLARQPRALRFHPELWHEPSRRRWPAMVALVTAPDGSSAAVHRTWLEVRADGSVGKAPLGKMSKATLGAYKGACIRLWRGASGKSLREAGPNEAVDITEGIEDGLSVALALPECRVLVAVSLPNMASVELPPAVRRVCLWRDNDPGEAARAAFRRAVVAHQVAGRTVQVASVPQQFKDVNELLQGSANV